VSEGIYVFVLWCNTWWTWMLEQKLSGLNTTLIWQFLFPV
jgi:hypothetical protein